MLLLVLVFFLDNNTGPTSVALVAIMNRSVVYPAAFCRCLFGKFSVVDIAAVSLLLLLLPSLLLLYHCCCIINTIVAVIVIIAVAAVTAVVRVTVS